MPERLEKSQWIYAFAVSFIRFPLILLVMSVTYIIGIILGLPVNFTVITNMSAMFIILVNIICLFILKHIVKRDNKSIRELVNFDFKKLGRDLMSGLVWCFVLFIPFIIAVMSVMWLFFRGDMFFHFEEVFAPNSADLVVLPKYLMLGAAILSATVFPILNAPVEELFYRGYAQTKFIFLSKKIWVGILIPAIGFSLQHILLTSTLVGAVVYLVAFLFWGIGAGVIYHKQKRLMPIIIAHFITNFFFGIIPLVIVLSVR